MSHIYVCLFSNGCIKVGRTTEPDVRIAAHADRVQCVGVDMVSHQVFSCIGLSELAEASLIRRCGAAAQSVRRREWFFGLDYEGVCELAHQESKRPYASEVVEPALTEPARLLSEIKQATRERELALARRLGVSQPTVNRILRGQAGCSSQVLMAILRLHSEVVTASTNQAAA